MKTMSDKSRRFVKLRHAVKEIYGGRLDLTGGRFGRLTVKEYVGKTKQYSMWRCVCDCGEERMVIASNLTSGDTKSCGCLSRDLFMEWQLLNCRNHTGAGNPRWKGGRCRGSYGYILVRCPGHPKARINGYVSEHRLVMEGKIGRYLLPVETVHHKNGVKDDNREENLELWSTSHPAGQRIEDQLEWAREILSRYGNIADAYP